MSYVSGELNRERLRVAALGIIGSEGIDGLSFDRLAECSGLSRAVVCGCYATPADCLYETYSWVVGGWLVDLRAALRDADDWHSGFVAWQTRLVKRLVDCPSEARLCVTEARAADRGLRQRREVAREWLVDALVDAYRAEHPGGRQPRVQIELMIGAGFRVIAACVEERGGEGLGDLVPEIVGVQDSVAPLPS